MHFYYFLKLSTKAQLQLIYKLSHSCMFQHYRAIFRELIISTLPSYTSCIRNTYVTWWGTDYKLPEDDTIVSNHVEVW